MKSQKFCVLLKLSSIKGNCFGCPQCLILYCILTHFVPGFPGPVDSDLDSFEIGSHLWRVGSNCDCQVETYPCKMKQLEASNLGLRGLPAWM